MLTALYNGHVQMWNYETSTMVGMHLFYLFHLSRLIYSCVLFGHKLIRSCAIASTAQLHTHACPLLWHDALFLPLQIRSFEVHDLPVRVAKFIERKNWIVCGSVCWATRLRIALLCHPLELSFRKDMLAPTDHQPTINTMKAQLFIEEIYLSHVGHTVKCTAFSCTRKGSL